MVKRKRDLTVCDPDEPKVKKANKVNKKKKPRLTWLEQRERQHQYDQKYNARLRKEGIQRNQWSLDSAKQAFHLKNLKNQDKIELQQEVAKVNAFWDKREAELKADLGSKLAAEVENYNKAVEQIQVVATQYNNIVEASRKYVKAMDELTNQITHRVIRNKKTVNLVDSLERRSDDWLQERSLYTKLIASLARSVKLVQKKVKPLDQQFKK